MNISGAVDSIIGKRKLHWRLDHALRRLGQLQGIQYRNIIDAHPGRAFVFCTSYINDPERYRRWIDHVSPRLAAFGADCVFLINDGSDNLCFDDRLALMTAGEPMPRTLPGTLNLVAFDERLGRPSMFCYPGWWRSFTYSVRLARHFGFTKIIHIESDAYVCSQRLADYIRSVNRGWTVLWSPTYGFPETALQIICKDAFPALEALANKGKTFFQQNNRAAEYLLPFDKVESSFRGDRCGVIDRNTSWQDYDYLAQVPLDRPLRFDY